MTKTAGQFNVTIWVRALKDYSDHKLTLPMDRDELNEIMDKITDNGQRDYEIVDYDGPFYVGPYDCPWELNELLGRLNEVGGHLSEDELRALLEYCDSLEQAVEGLENETIRLYNLGTTFPQWANLAEYLVEEYGYLEGYVYESLRKSNTHIDHDTLMTTIKTMINLGLVDYERIGRELYTSGCWYLCKNGIAVEDIN